MAAGPPGGAGRWWAAELPRRGAATVPPAVASTGTMEIAAEGCPRGLRARTVAGQIGDRSCSRVFRTGIVGGAPIPSSSPVLVPDLPHSVTAPLLARYERHREVNERREEG
ncbi:hypothetical protein FRAHR75_190060 [Frankia sp. Hr75.2]|nr:hypothetical protein FRAHR75_190060 [Frankia sp. Hr75.2]